MTKTSHFHLIRAKTRRHKSHGGRYYLADMSVVRYFLLALLFSLTPLISACNSNDQIVSSGHVSSTDLVSTEREFWSRAVTQNGSPHKLVEGTRIMLHFSNDNVSASAGCNFIGGTFHLDANTLVVSELAMTEKGCNPDLHAQDDLLIALLTDAPTVALDGDILKLIGTDLHIEFVDRHAASPDRDLTGTHWAVTGFIGDRTASSFAIDEAGWFSFDDQSTMKGDDGCAPFTVNVEVFEGEAGRRVKDDAQVLFGLVEDGLDSLCVINADYVKAFRALFDTGVALVQINGDRLTMLNTNGRGVTAQTLD